MLMPSFQITDVIVMPNKHPSTSRAYTVNLASADGTNDASASDTGFLQARTVSSISITTPSGITLDSSSNDTLSFTLNVSAGTQGQPYDFTVAVTLSTTFVEQVIVRVPVQAQT